MQTFNWGLFYYFSPSPFFKSQISLAGEERAEGCVSRVTCNGLFEAAQALEPVVQNFVCQKAQNDLFIKKAALFGAKARLHPKAMVGGNKKKTTIQPTNSDVSHSVGAKQIIKSNKWVLSFTNPSHMYISLILKRAGWTSIQDNVNQIKH